MATKKTHTPATLDPARFAASLEDDTDPGLGKILSRATSGSTRAPQDAQPTAGQPRKTSATVTPITQPKTGAGESPKRKTGAAVKHPKTTAPSARSKPKQAARGDGDDERAKASAVHIPSSLTLPLESLSATTGWTNAMMLIAAIEDCVENNRLDELLNPSTVGGTFFPVMTTKPQGPKVSGKPFALSISMPPTAYTALDELAAKHNTNRSRLATVALTDYLERNNYFGKPDDN